MTVAPAGSIGSHPEPGERSLDDRPVDTVDTLDLRDYVAVLRRRRWIVVQAVVVVVAVAMAVTYTRTPLYEATTRVVIEPNTGGGDDAMLRQLVFGQQQLQTEAELVQSDRVAIRAAERLARGDDPNDLLEQVDVSLVGDTQIIEISAVSDDPQEAAAIAAAFGEGYLGFRRQQALDQILTASEAITERERETRERIEQIEQELGNADEGEAQGLELERERLQSELAGLAAQRATLSGSEVFARAGGQIVAPARVPEQPFSPRPLRTGVLALVLGLMLGVGLAFLRDFMDDAIRSDEQVRRATGRPVLGHVPRWAATEKGDTRVVSLVEPASPISEAYRTLRTNVRFLTVDHDLSSLLVTSPLPGEGKTTTAANLAVALARAGTRVLLVGADLRKPTIHRNFGIEAHPGLSATLVGDATYAEAIVDVGVPNLRVIPGGQVPPNPAELLGSAAMARLMADLEQIADVVVYDGPPVLAVSDTLEFAPRTGGCLVVVDSGATGRSALRHATERLHGVGADITGIVLNRIDPQDGYYGYDYYQDYLADEQERPARVR